MEALMRLEQPPTAVFATSDLFTCGAMQYLYRQGKRVPDDMSLVGYDDTLSTLLAPPITSVRLSLDEIGKQALELLLKRMQDIQASSRTVTIQTVLIDRQSVSSIA
jgi:LacI family transcriptional regulator